MTYHFGDYLRKESFPLASGLGTPLRIRLRHGVLTMEYEKGTAVYPLKQDLLFMGEVKIDLQEVKNGNT